MAEPASINETYLCIRRTVASPPRCGNRTSASYGRRREKSTTQKLSIWVAPTNCIDIRKTVAESTTDTSVASTPRDASGNSLINRNARLVSTQALSRDSVASLALAEIDTDTGIESQAAAVGLSPLQAVAMTLPNRQSWATNLRFSFCMAYQRRIIKGRDAGSQSIA